MSFWGQAWHHSEQYLYGVGGGENEWKENISELVYRGTGGYM